MGNVKPRKIVQIRKRNGLSSITTKKGRITPMLFKQKVVDRNTDGEMVGEYTQPTFPGTIQYVVPYIKEEGGWYWGGTEEKLIEIIQKAKLRKHLGKFRGYDKYGDVIEPGDVNRRLSDPQDEFFTHPQVRTAARLEGGRVNLDLESNPLHEFIYYCSVGNPEMFKSKKSDTNNKFYAAGWVYEIIESDIETQKRADEADKEMEAISELADMKNDDDKMRVIAKVLGIPGYSDTLSTSALFVLLKDSAAQNTAKALKFGSNTTYQDKFIELAKTDTGILEVMGKIEDGIKLRRITPDGRGGFQMNGEELSGVRNKTQLIDFFRNIDNQQYYTDLIKFLEDVKQRT